VEGQSWFDHEFGTQQMGAEVAGWNWFSITLSDGSDLMLYLLRRADGQYDSHSAGTVVSPDGHAEHLTQDQFSVEATATWTSPHTGATYPSAWRIRVPGRALELEGAPLLPDQELQSPQTVQVTYWEGATLFRGTQGGQPVEGRGYVELTGYAKALTRIF
jgi:predicted secreted hydrolase